MRARAQLTQQRSWWVPAGAGSRNPRVATITPQQVVESGHSSRLCRSGTFLAVHASRVMNSSARSLPLRYARPGGMSRRVDRRFGASQARIARGEHQWVGLPTMHMTRIGGMEKVVRNGGAMTSAPVQTHHPPSTGGEGGGCSFKPNKYVANTCPASPDV